MPSVVRIPLISCRVIEIDQHAVGLRALFYRWISAASPEIGQALHEIPGRKPFSIHSFIDSSDPVRAVVEISLLDDRLIATLLEGVALCGNTVKLGSHELFLEHPPLVAESVSWAMLVDPAGHPVRRWSLRFVTPTAFHRAGQRARRPEYRPLPQLAIQGWLDSWNRFAPSPLPGDFADAVAPYVSLCIHRGVTEQRNLDRRRCFIGFVGDITYACGDQVSDPDVMMLDCLVRYSRWCGTGVDTVRGMGVTRRLEEVVPG